MHRNISIGNDVYIAHNAWINGTGGLIIKDEVIISPNVIITTTKHLRKDNKVSNYYSTNQKVIIGKGTWIAGNSTIGMGVEIGSGCIISANSLINKTIRGNNLLIGGVPAYAIKSLGETDV
ncbi:acyltransferase [Staphylococcus xylosus]|uniref:acyltransferase n=1 Tax=Staphylococcus xylosus TaxID=1288 RepID=UPI0018AD1E36|nr:acyltransferase [Staphylococcus xylosus]